MCYFFSFGAVCSKYNKQTENNILFKKIHSYVLNVNIRDYTQEDVDDWASCGNDLKNWEEQFAGVY